VHCSAPELDPPSAPVASITSWPAYGGEPSGQRHADGLTIGPETVGRLVPAWTYRHGDVSDGTGDVQSTTADEHTPILVDGTLYLCTPFNRVIALDPVTGEERWAFDPEIDLSGRFANQLICRGVAAWRDASAATDAACARTIFAATNDAHLWALDAADGTPCPAFGAGGAIDLNPGVGEQRWYGEYQVTSPPAVVGDLVVVGSAVSDNNRTTAPSGVVRAFDARTGAPAWAWDLAPPGFDRETRPTSDEGFALGTPNVWAPMAVDEARGLIFVPTGNAAPDYYHGERRDMNHYGSSVVALWARTGAVVWHFQTVHDDLWDFDVPAQPTLTTIELDGRPRDVVIQATKMGLLFVLDRDTGRPVRPVEERPVPQEGAVPGEHLSPTQPFPHVPMLARGELTPDDAWGLTPWDRGRCRERIESLRYEGIYTPPSLEGTIMYPGNAGGTNWGGIAVDPVRQLALVRTSNLAFVVTMIPRDEFARERASHDGHEHGPQLGTPYGMRRHPFLSPLGLPCVPPPWGTLSAVDLRSGTIRWQVPHGTVRDLAPVPIPIGWGVPGLGGPLVTARGLVFIAAAFDDYLRAYDVETGEELWKARLPAGGQATPMGYRVTFEDGSARQYVLIAAGGHGRAGTTLGDHLVAFALEEE
jgi:quinoprotein glucose dehydrogenase